MESNRISDLDNLFAEKKFYLSDCEFLIWPIVRRDVLINYYLRNKSLNLKAHKPEFKFSAEILKYFFQTFYFAPNKIKDCFDIIFYDSSRGRSDNRNFNINTDYFSNLIEKSLCIDFSYKMKYKIPDNTKNFATGDYNFNFVLRGLIKFLFDKIIRKYDNQGVNNFIYFINKNKILDNNFLLEIKEKLIKFCAYYLSIKNYQLNLFKNLKPKIIFINAASYGGSKSILIKTSKEQNILTGEIQHGLISTHHPSYNYGKEILRHDEYRKYFPDYLLTYGEYWNEKMKIPGETITIGAPHFYNSIKRYENIEEKKKTILIVSQGTMTSTFVEIADFLSKTMSNYKIIFKLHPGEIGFKERYKTLYKLKNVKIAIDGDIYRFIAQCENIVACYSTTIFESLGFSKKIFIIDNEMSREHIPDEIGIRFKEKQELKNLISAAEKQNDNYDLDYFFNSSWKENYERFLEEKIGIKSL